MLLLNSKTDAVNNFIYFRTYLNIISFNIHPSPLLINITFLMNSMKNKEKTNRIVKDKSSDLQQDQGSFRIDSLEDFSQVKHPCV